MKYLIYDTALNGLPTLMVLQKYYAVNQSLFKGTKDEALIEAAPWLFRIDPEQDEGLSEEADLSLLFTLQFDSAGDIHSLSAHLRKFIYQVIDGREYFFRFYDARVLKKFLPTCDQEQVLEFFGPIDQFLVGGDGQEDGVRFRHENGVLKKQAIVEMKNIT